MNNPLKSSGLQVSAPLSADSPELQHLFDQIAAGAAERERERIPPYDVVDLIRQSRFGALRIPSRDGGGGSSIRELLDAVIRLGSADANVAHILRNHFSVVERLIRIPYDDQSRQWQRAVSAGSIIGLATTELSTPRVGNVKPDTILTPDGDGYRLNGTKYYSTGSLYADYILVRAAVENEDNAALLIPINRDGIELLDDWDGMGQRLTGTGTTHFHNVRVERTEVVFDTADVGYGTPYSNTFAQIYLTAINAGIADAVLRDARTMVQQRGRNFYYAPAERPAEDTLVQLNVGQISSNAFAARSIVLAAADALDKESAAREKGLPSEKLAAHAALLSAQAKVVVDELAIRSGSLLFDAGGASITKRSANYDRHWRNARTLASHNPNTLKARAIGDFEINGTPLPAKGFF
jgi:alkylation response protein AidB-like acyl-CoA dehydrogenase